MSNLLEDEIESRLGELPAVSILAQVQAYRRVGESARDAAERILIREALNVSNQSTADAAVMLGVTVNSIGYVLRKYRPRPRRVSDAA